MDTPGTKIPAMELPALAQENLTIAGVSAAGAALKRACGVVRLAASADCHVAVNTEGGAPVATTASMFMAAGATEYFTVRPGSGVSVKLAVIQA
jgi:hypothetical protein